MPETNIQQIKVLDSRSLVVRIGIVVALIAALVFGWTAIRRQLGNMLAELTSPTDSGAKSVARIAVDFAPTDSTANWLFVNTNNSGVKGTEINLERVVRLSPADFRWWIEYGREREQAGNVDKAEKALQKAVGLAPNYTIPRWHLGNFYLRQNRSEEAFVELAKAAESSSIYREQVFSMAWEYFERDTAQLEQIAGSAADSRAGLAKFYAGKGRAEDSLRVWNTLSEAEKQANADGARVIAQALYEKGFLRAALEFVRQLGIEPDAEAETFQNGGFEKPIGDAKDVYFGWQVSPVEKVDVKLDPTHKFEGNRSLRVTFSGYAQPTLYAVYQIITVEPKSKYRLSFRLRTENLKSGGAPNLEIFDSNGSKNIAFSPPFPAGTNDWQLMKIEFTAPENAEAVGIRTTRVFCGADCPIIGTFWYDDFKLEKIK